MSTGLRVVAESPDAMCPTLAEAEAAIVARVGEVVGGPYTVKYTIVRDPENQRELVRMSVTDEGGALVLERSIPVGSGGCSEAAQAMALILERHFQSLEAPVEPIAVAPAPAEQAPAALTGSSATPPESAAAEAAPAADSARNPSNRDEREQKRVSLRAGFGLREAPQAIAQLGVEFRLTPAVALSLDAVTSLGEETTEELGYTFATRQLGLEFSTSWLVPLGQNFELGVGPLVGVRMEVARLDDEEVGTGSQDRFVPHLGLQGLGRLSLGPILHLDLTGRAAGVLAGLATSFDVETVDGQSVEVLEPRPWLGEAILSLGVRL